MNEYNFIIATNMKILRENSGVSAKDMAEACGVSVTWYAKYENNEYNVPAYAVKLFADKLKINVEEVYYTNEVEICPLRKSINRYVNEMNDKQKQALDNIVRALAKLS